MMVRAKPLCHEHFDTRIGSSQLAKKGVGLNSLGLRDRLPVFVQFLRNKSQTDFHASLILDRDGWR
jgi:hypothetical protein